MSATLRRHRVEELDPVNKAALGIKPPHRGWAWVYVVTNRETGKQYVGITTFAVRRRWRRHCNRALANKKRNGDCPALHAAIRKYGEDAFTVEQVYLAFSWEAALAAEIDLIATSCTKVPGGYNLTDGGEGVLGMRLSEKHRHHLATVNIGRKHNPETKQKRSEAMRGRMWTAEQRAKLKGRPKSAAHRANLSAAKKGKKVSDAGREAIRLGHIGIRPSTETRAKMGAWQVGKKHSDITRARISAALRARREGVGTPA